MSNPKIYSPPQQPYRVANEFLKRHHTHKVPVPPRPDREVQTLGQWRGDWYRWIGGHWEKIIELDLKAELYRVLDDAQFVSLDKDGNEQFHDWNPTRGKIGGILDPLETLSHQLLKNDLNAPFWITTYDDAPEDPAEYIGMSNGLYMRTTGRLVGHDPELFNTWSLPFSYDKDATCPIWNDVLGQIFEHDEKAAQFLQEWAGYLISGRTDLQKAALIVGPPGAGKGTISRLLKQLVGTTNAVSPSLYDLGSDFGASQLIGKPLAIIEDSRDAGGKNSSRTVERFLSITGEDQMGINVKQKDFWNGTLPTRIMLFANEVPRLEDASGALERRFIAARLELDFRKNPDKQLSVKLARELPGIFNWALEGLDRLERNGRFTIPDTHEQTIQTMQESAAPIKAFLRDTYTVTGNLKHWVEVSGDHGVLKAYRAWCEDSGATPVTRDELTNKIDGAGIPGVKFRNGKPPEDGVRPCRFIQGIQQQIEDDDSAGDG